MNAICVNPRILGRFVVAGLLVMPLSHAEVGNPRVNQLGYLPNAPKVAVYAADHQQPMGWELRQDGSVVSSGTTVPKGWDEASGENLHHIDLSSVGRQGTGYTLHVQGDRSHAFSIASDLYQAPLYDALRYFYHNRSGIEIETRFSGGGLGSYAPSQQWARPAGHLGSEPNQGDVSVACWPGTCDYSLDVSKGWYDAGDHGKYVVNGGISVWKLLNLYERSMHIDDSGALYADGRLNIPESGNGVADLLDEARWQMEFLLAMQVPAGEAMAGMAHHKIHDIGWTGIPLAPHEDGRVRALVPPSITATLNLTATAAQCARVWADVDAVFSQRCLAAAVSSWEAAQRHPNLFYNNGFNNGGGGYGDNDASDEFFWAAAELFITTGDARYLSVIDAFEVERTGWGWPDTEIPGLMSLAIVPAPHSAHLREQARAQIVGIAEHHRGRIEANGYLVPHTPRDYYWGSNNVLANKLVLLALAHDFTGDEAFASAFSNALDYLFGRNTLSYSFVSGHGEAAMSAPHHRFWAAPVDPQYPSVPPGALAGGPNSGLQDALAQARLSGCTERPASCYIDHIDSFSTNEVTINWNAGLVWVLAYQHGRSGAGDRDQHNRAPIADFTASTLQGEAPLSISLDASNSFDADGDALSYNWTFGDGTTASGESLIHTFVSAGEFVVELAVNDGRGGSDRTQVSVRVTEPADDEGPAEGSQCNWYGQLYPLCQATQSGWGWEDNRSCIAVSTCEQQPDPWGIVGPDDDGNDDGDGDASQGHCEFVITNEWNSGYTAAIRINNDSSERIQGWTVSWRFSHGASLTNSWNAEITGTNPYTASDMGWNASIEPGQHVEFGLQASRGAANPEIPVITGDVCNSQ